MRRAWAGQSSFTAAMDSQQASSGRGMRPHYRLLGCGMELHVEDRALEGIQKLLFIDAVPASSTATCKSMQGSVRLIGLSARVHACPPVQTEILVPDLSAPRNRLTTEEMRSGMR